MSEPLWRQGAAELAAAIGRREISSTEVVQAHLDRMTEVDGAVNAIAHRFDEEALRAAAEADRTLADGIKPAPLHGVPVSVKVDIPVAGQPADEAVGAMADDIALADAPPVRNLRDAGAIIMARTNMPDMGMRWNTDSDLYGRTLNPWDPALTPGGSSGGDAVAVATGASPLSLGNDYGGALRLPAAYAGVTSLRPTPGRFPVWTESDADRGVTSHLFYTDGPVARSVQDLALAFDVLRKADKRDALWLDVTLGPSGPCRALVVGDVLGQTPHPDVVAGLDAAAAGLEREGYQLESGPLPDLQAAADLWQNITATEMGLYFDANDAPIYSAAAQGWLKAFLATSAPYDLKGYASALADRYWLASSWATLMEEFPLIVAPVDTDLPWARDWDSSGDVEPVVRVLRERYAVNLATSLVGVPSITIPVGVGESGLPRSVQLISWRFSERRLLAAGAAVERHAPPITPIDPVQSKET